MKVGDLVRIKDNRLGNQRIRGKLAIIVVNGTWSVDVRIFENGLNPRISKKDCEVINESR